MPNLRNGLRILGLKIIFEQIAKSEELKDMWNKYQKKFTYASNITFENVLEVLKKLLMDN